MSIGFGILCFGEDSYFKEASEKVRSVLDKGYECYVLTDNRKYFEDQFWTPRLKLIDYSRNYKSYHDKLILPKFVLNENEICILIDADLTILDETFYDDLINHEYNKGITYVDILLNHPRKKRYVWEMDMSNPDWSGYKKYIDSIYPQNPNLELIWEYLLIINKDEFFSKPFYYQYERLQLVKENCDLFSYREVLGNGEGISLSISSHLSDTPISRDYVLYEKIKDKVKNISRKYTRPEHI
jgi:hypothetical protein